MKWTRLAIVLFLSVLPSATPTLTRAEPLTRAIPKQDECIEDWSEASRIVKAEKLTSVEQLASAAQRERSGAIVRTTLCREGGRYVYRLVIRDRRGTVSRESVDAQQPFAGKSRSVGPSD